MWTRLERCTQRQNSQRVETMWTKDRYYTHEICRNTQCTDRSTQRQTDKQTDGQTSTHEASGNTGYGRWGVSGTEVRRAVERRSPDVLRSTVLVSPKVVLGLSQVIRTLTRSCEYIAKIYLVCRVNRVFCEYKMLPDLIFYDFRLCIIM